MKLKLLIFLFATLSAFSTEQDYKFLCSQYSEIAQKYGFILKKSASPYNPEQTLVQNLKNFGEKKYFTFSDKAKFHWLNAALVYQAYSRWQGSPLWCYFGNRYHSSRVLLKNNENFSITKHIGAPVSSKFEEQYLLYGQINALLFKLVIEEFKYESRKSFAKNYVNDMRKQTPISFLNKLLYLKMSKYDNLDNWFRIMAKQKASSVFNNLPAEMIYQELNELLQFKISELKDGKLIKLRTVDATGLAKENLPAVVLAELVRVKINKLIKLWLDSPVIHKETIGKFKTALELLPKKKFDQFNSRVRQLRVQFIKENLRMQRISRLMDKIELTTYGSDILKEQRKIVQHHSTKPIANYLDQIERQIESLKE